MDIALETTVVCFEMCVWCRFYLAACLCFRNSIGDWRDVSVLGALAVLPEDSSLVCFG